MRELGRWGHQIADAVSEGSILGPSFYRAASPICMTAGHGDAHGVSLPALQDAVEYGLPLRLCDGVPDCIEAVR